MPHLTILDYTEIELDSNFVGFPTENPRVGGSIPSLAISIFSSLMPPRGGIFIKNG